MTTTDGDSVFGYPLLVAESFDGVLAGSGVLCALGDVRSLMQRHGRLLLQARGGAGKTRTAERIAALEPESSGVAFVAARNLSEGLTDASAVLDLEIFVALSKDRLRADILRDQLEGLIVIDGINEVTRNCAEKILMAIPVLAARYPFIRFLITDRLSRRDIDQTEWVLATLGPVPSHEVRSWLNSGVDPVPEHLTIPYYLNQTIHQGGDRSQVDILRSGITVHGGVPELSLRSLARSIYDSYGVLGERVVDLQKIDIAVGSDVLTQMLSSGLLVQENERFQFKHHLAQDFLAALHLSVDERLWNSEGLDTVTLKASSFDALALVAALIPRKRVDDFVHCVFDWNYYGAAYLLEEDQSGERRVRDAMRLAILGMLAEKRFDRMIVTAQRVEDALRLQDLPLAVLLLSAKNRDEVVAAIEAELPVDWVVTWPQWFRLWYESFERKSGSDATRADIEKMKSEVGMVGWGSSNTLKRLNTSTNLRQRVENLATEHEDATVRWRAVHTLGAWPTRDVVDTLLDRIRRPTEQLWVRYGALRSLLEIAANGLESLRVDIFSVLGGAEVASLVALEPNLRKEAIRALEVSPMPADWHALAGDFMEHLWSASDDTIDRNQVLLLANRLRGAKKVDA